MSEQNFLIFGRNPVIEAIETGTDIDKILIQKNIEGSGKKAFALAKKAKIPVQIADKFVLDKTAGGGAHQGVIAYLAEYTYASVDEIFARAESKGEAVFLILLDGIEDPHNLGAIIRSAECAGAHGIVIPNRRAAAVTGAAMKASAGAALHIPVARVTNIASAIDVLKDRGVWIYGLDMNGEHYATKNYDGAAALVVGSEGRGISRIVREKCDFVLSIPMRGRTGSLNASNAAAIALFEMSRKLFPEGVSADRRQDEKWFKA
ncbi:MAG: 23S rRNA (guanosine(2251)-2'-O)-methyltransferase RlmB [Clostridiales Family XIII bacterium]|jgi:23S rRNA (guanosine2251-2'-O)-methyltransferase|nr:23S rRNA (guanosine(2251)-2'-O)-methyltransferase RlmB [Clostridiales Family XIII bacterium]